MTLTLTTTTPPVAGLLLHTAVTFQRATSPFQHGDTRLGVHHANTQRMHADVATDTGGSGGSVDKALHGVTTTTALGDDVLTALMDETVTSYCTPGCSSAMTMPVVVSGGTVTLMQSGGAVAWPSVRG